MISLQAFYAVCYFHQKGYSPHSPLLSAVVVKAPVYLCTDILKSNGHLYKYDIEQCFSDFEAS